MYKVYLALTIAFFFSISSFAQVGIGTVTPDPSAILDVESTTAGLLMPRMTTTQRDNITSPQEGLFIYNLDSSCFQFYKTTGWSGCLGEFPTNSLNCSSATVNGAYTMGGALTTSNTITIDVLTNVIEAYTITTNTVNGYSFSATGSFSSIGSNTITLQGTGTPGAIQTDTFTITFNGSSATCTVDVNVSLFLANCLEYYNSGVTSDGVYTIDPDGGAGPIAPYDCYCDMTNDGGGWTLVFNHNTAGGYWTNDVEASFFNSTTPGISTNKYSILSKLDELKSNAVGPYEFRLHFPSLGLTNHWSQTFDPRSGASTTRPVLGYTAINISMTQSFWGGLELSGGNTYLDGSVNSGNWWYSIGSINPYSGGIPGNSTPVNQVQLFIR